jgi:hypothetical protein
MMQYFVARESPGETVARKKSADEEMAKTEKHI